MSLDVGSQVAQYRLERRLGAGGMGEVYLARDTRLDRLVAIKFLIGPSDDLAHRRLLHEARAVAALDHHNICAVYEVGTDPAEGDFIAMQYIEGDTLAGRLRRGRLRPDEALTLGAQVADALVAAHHRGIVHRDLKPQNIMITPAGMPKLLDFGIATHAVNTPAAANAATASQLSDPRAIAGTPAYMSPEQVRNEPADVRSDVFALGCVLYECLTGRRAFSASSTAETLGQVLHVDPPPVSSVVPEVGPAYDGLCARLLHKIPGERFQSAEEVLGAIRALTPSARLSADGSTPAPPAPRRLSRRALVATVAVLAIGYSAFRYWPRESDLPAAPPDAARWYDRGVEAMRDGTYAAARTEFSEAIRLFPSYAVAYSRLAEAHMALDDDRSAHDALLQVARQLVLDRSRLRPDDRLRFDAASAAALRKHDAAIQAYRELADRQPRESGRWLDVGRAEEAASRTPAALESYKKAVSLDGQSAAARLRAGVLTVRAAATAADRESGLASIDEAIRLYHAAAKTEGEAEACLRKAIALGAIGRFNEARQLLDVVLGLATDYPAQRVGAQFELARLDYSNADFAQAEKRARQAVSDATAAGLPTLAASGLLTLGNALMGRGTYDAADGQYAKAIDLARERGSKRTEMLATLQQASLRVQTDRPDDALSLAAGPLKYFKDSGEARLTAKANSIMSRADEALERYDEASRLAAEAVTFAEAAKDDVTLAEALENLAGQLTKLGRLPEALSQRERIDSIHRRLRDQAALPRDLANHAELLILLGRGPDAEVLLREVDDGIAKKIDSYVGRRVRVALLRTLLASTERRWADVVAGAAAVEAASSTPSDGAAAKPTYAQLFARILAEHARAHVGRSRATPAAMAAWPADATSPVDRREWSFWVAQTLIARKEPKLALKVAGDALGDPSAKEDHELTWRLAAVAAQAEKALPPAANGVSMAPQAKTNVDQIATAWAGAAASYFARPDLAELRKSVR